MLFADKLSFDHPRITADGYMVVRARAARAGIYDYRGSEVDPGGKAFAKDQTVRVYRPQEEVFAADSVASFLMKPVTDDHPSQPVTAANWRDNAKGVVGKALRDGDYLAFDIVLMDKGIIDAVDSGKRELSNGYSSLIDFTAGETEAGEHYDAVQKQIRGNHVAVVANGRAGPMCRINDAATCERLPGADLIELLTDERTYSGENGSGNNEPARRETSSPSEPGNRLQDGGSQVAKTVLIDGYKFEVDDALETAVTKLQGQITTLTADKAKVEGDLKTANEAVSTKDGEIAALNKKLEDAKLSPEQIEKMVADRSALVATAKAIEPTLVADGKSEAEIRKAVVSAKLGDAAKDMDDAAVSGAFAVLAKDVKVETKDGLRETIASQPVNVGDAKTEYAKARDKARDDMSKAWRQPAPANAA